MNTCTFLLSVVLAAAPPQDEGGKLKKFEKTLKKEKKKKPAVTSERPHSHSPDEELAEWFLYLLLQDAAGEFFAYPFLDHNLRFDDYPYAGGTDEYFLAGQGQSLALETRSSYSRIDHDLYAIGLGGTLFLGSGADFTYQITQYVEELQNTTDRLTLQQIEFNYGPGASASRNFHWSIGWGIATLESAGQNTGLSLQATVRVFLHQPLSLRFHASAMAIDSATLNDLQAEIRYHVDQFAVSLGMRTLINSQGDELTGPTVGVDFWF